jgi:cytochrome c-type biogenesis protein CcmF
VLHPPFLYAGYVGFAVTFAMTLSALLSRQLNTTWATHTKQYALAAWCLLTIGIMLGSWWAYRVLGWGGFWFWDPVENASIMPWLAGIGLIHLLHLVEKRNIATDWACLLAIITFTLSLLGTFLVRSGILISVHNFATDPKRGILLLLILMVITTAALMIYFLCLPTIKQRKSFSFYSKDMALLSQSLLLTTAMLTILIGTLYPLFLDAIHAGNISVGAPYFNTVLLPITVLSLFIMGLSSYLPWQDLHKLCWQKPLRDIFLSSVCGSVISWLLLNRFDFCLALIISLCLWVFISLRESKLSALGMQTAHAGFAICILGITLSTSLKIEKEVTMSVNQPIIVGPYEFTLLETKSIHAKNYHGIRADIVVKKQGRFITLMQPEKRIYPVRQMILTQTAIDPSFFRDLYIALGQPLTDNNWSARIYYKPFIRWIWLGALVMALGGLIARLPRKIFYAGVTR